MKVFALAALLTLTASATFAQDQKANFPILNDMSNAGNLATTAKSVKELEDRIKPEFEKAGYALQDFGCHVEVTIGPDGKPQPTVVCGGGFEF